VLVPKRSAFRVGDTGFAHYLSFFLSAFVVGLPPPSVFLSLPLSQVPQSSCTVASRFFKALQEVAGAFLDYDWTDHPMLEQFARSFAWDKRLPVEHYEIREHVRELFEEFKKLGTGARVELRRWWSFYDAAEELDSQWNTILFFLLANDLMGGGAAEVQELRCGKMKQKRNNIRSGLWLWRHCSKGSTIA
jgi:hypothetical protein